MARHLIRDVSALITGAMFIMIGFDHFVRPEWYEPLVPKVLGNPEFWVYLSGVTEVGFGLTIIPRKTREYSAVFGISMLVALYWANLNMWVNDIPLGGVTYGQSFHLIRLSIQILMIITTLLIAGGIYDVPEKMRN